MSAQSRFLGSRLGVLDRDAPLIFCALLNGLLSLRHLTQIIVDDYFSHVRDEVEHHMLEILTHLLKQLCSTRSNNAKIRDKMHCSYPLKIADTECTEWLSRVVQEKITQQIIEHEHPIPYQEEERPVVHCNNNESAIPLLEMQQPMPLPQMQQQILQH
jgi:hypothetical protein